MASKDTVSLVKFDTTFTAPSAWGRLEQALSYDTELGPVERHQIKNAFKDYVAQSTAFLARPSYNESQYVFLPAGLSRIGERSFHVIGFNGQNMFEAAFLEHIPIEAEIFQRKRRAHKAALPVLSMEERVEATVDKWRSIDSILDKRDLRDEYSLQALFDSENLLKAGEKARRRWLLEHVPSLVKPKPGEVIVTFNLATGASEERREIDFPPDLNPEKILRDMDEDILKRAINCFKEPLDRDVLAVMANIPGQQSVMLYTHLRPIKKTTVEEVYMDENDRRQKRKKVVVEPFVELAEKRREFFCKYPLAASSLQSFSTHPVIREIGHTIHDPEKAASLLWPQASTEVLHTIQGLNEADVGSSVARNFEKIAASLSAIGKEFYPVSLEDWQAFEIFNKADEQLANAHFRPRGKTISDFVELLVANSERSWGDLAHQYDGDRGGYLSVSLRNILTLADSVGISCMAPLALNMSVDLRHKGVNQGDIVACSGSFSDVRMHGISLRAKSLARNPRQLSLSGELYREDNIARLLGLARHFDTHLGEWDKRRRQLAVSDAFNEYPADQKWRELPNPAFDYVGFEEDQVYDIQSIHQASEGQKFLTSMGDELAVRRLKEVAYEPIHFLSVRKNHDGSAQALAILEEEQPETSDILALRVKEILSNEGSSRISSNRVANAVHERTEWINGRRLRAKPYAEARMSLRRKAEQRAGIRGQVGHNPFDPDQNRQAVEILHDVLPQRFRRAGQWGCLADRFLYQRSAALLQSLNPKIVSDKQPNLRFV